MDTIGSFGGEVESHTHSGYSDGMYRDEGFYEKMLAIRRKYGIPLKTICITDHDTMNGYEPLRRIFRRRRGESGEEIKLLAGIEFTCRLKGREAHILGYFAEIKAGILNRYLKPAAEKIISWNELRLLEGKVLGGILSEQYELLGMEFNLDYRAAEGAARLECQKDIEAELKKKAGDELIWKPNVSRSYIRRQIEKQLGTPEKGLQSFTMRSHSGGENKAALRDFYRRNCCRNSHLIEEAVERSAGIILYTKLESRSPVSAEEAVEAIALAGGWAVLAHPGENILRQEEALDKDKTEERLKEIAKLIDSGLKGVEVHYPSHSTEQREILSKFAGDYGLVECGGSDWHGKGKIQDRRVGRFTPGGMVKGLGIV